MNLTWTEIFHGTLSAYARSAAAATQGLRKNWILLVGSVGLFFVFSVLAYVLAPLGMAGGMLVGLLGVAALALYYGWLAETVARQRLRKEDLFHLDVSLFFGFISVSFVLWLAQLALSLLTAGAGADSMQLFFSLGIIFVFNALPEVVYLHRTESIPALQEAFRFTRDNWIEWYVPFLLITAPFLLLSPAQFPLLLASNYPLLPISMVFQVPQLLLPPGWGLIAAVVGVVLANWFMLFRAHLFQELERGTRRQRAFSARQK